MGTEDYRISVLRPAAGLIVVEATGELDLTNSYDFSEQLLALLKEGPVRMVLDLSGVAYLDAYALGALLDMSKRCEVDGCGLAIACPQGRVRSALAGTGLDQVIATWATLDEALGRDDPAL